MIQPTSPDGVIAAVRRVVAARPGRARVAIDGAPAARPEELAVAMVEALAPRRALHVRSDGFWKPAGQRLERGRHNADAWLDEWLDAAALTREVLDPMTSTGRVTPAIRDPASDRSARAAAVDLPEDGIVLVSGPCLLGRGLAFDICVHLHLTSAAMSRRTDQRDQWTLSALARYEAERTPDDTADVVIRADDPRHPALVTGTERS